MKKLVLVVTLIGLSVVWVGAQSRPQSRPRVIVNDPFGTPKPRPTPRPTPDVVQDDTAATTTTERRAPVLQGDATVTTPGERRAPVLQGGRTNPIPTATPEEVVDEGDDEVIRVETNLVTMPVSVLDRDGRFIAGLQQRDFQVLENGVKQKVEYFQPVEQPFTVILLIDVSPSTKFKIDEIQDAAIGFINQLRGNDRVQVISFDEKVNVLSPVTSDRRILANAVRQAQFGDGTSLYEAVDFAITRQLSQVQGRKAVVIFTDGVDTTSRRANIQNTLRTAEESEALIYPIRYDTQADMNGGFGGGGGTTRAPRGGGWGAILGTILTGGNVRIGGGGGGGGAGSSSREYETGRQYLADLARVSGGRNFEAKNDLRAAFTGIAEELRWQYSIGYYPEKVGEIGERRQIRIRVMRPNVVVRAKTSYIVGKSGR